ncbi:MAG TPA: tetratricopeptide repeat protein [Chthoniobacteraceae bacterium]|jgi:tetratricopeptide (TPR) repeat protein|nr:hypothetical protein [Chthoniobacter sp.]HEV7868621.1 tetratricopeptide repeat protein [Chthoniobacteraceae bacterium]
MKAAIFASSAILLLGAAFAAHGEEAAPLVGAQRALREGLPQIAAHKLKTFLDDGTVPAEQRERGTLLLAEALLTDSQFDEALAALDTLADGSASAARLLRAHVFVGATRWSEALTIYQELALQPGTALIARLGEAECMQALGRTAEAVEALEDAHRIAPSKTATRLRLASLLVELRQWKKAHLMLSGVQTANATDEHWKSYVEARLLLGQGHAEPALTVFETLLNSREGLPENLLVGATLGAADARIILQGYGSADRPLETFIWRYPESGSLDSVFAKLDHVYSQQPNPTEDELQKWALKQPPPCAALARFYLARMQIRSKKPDKAAAWLDVFVKGFPSHRLVPSAHLMQADLLLEKGDLAGAVRALEAAERRARNDEQRAEIQLRTGLVFTRQGQFLLAANEFRRAANRSPKLRENATFNAALAMLNQSNYDRFLLTYRELTAQFAESPLRSELIVEEGLTRARHADARAEQTLQLALSHFPTSPRKAEVTLALAELAYAQRDYPTTSRYLQAANTLPATPESAEHAQYLGVFLAAAETPNDDREAIRRAQEFIRQFPKSTLLPEVRMKLGQIFLRSSDYRGAETQFATLAKDNPTSAYAETALFLAGQSAMQWIDPSSVDRALKLFDEVVKRGGSLKLHARQQQAIVQSKLGNEAEAVTLYDALLTAKPPPEPELRFAAMAGKGDNLLILGRKTPTQLEAAAAVFTELASAPNVPPNWRNQALYKKARALEALNRTADALVTYYDVLERGTDEAQEYFWFYKAGYDAARMFQEKSDWKEAIGIYQKMARVKGPRSEEAKQRASELALKHFIPWE